MKELGNPFIMILPSSKINTQYFRNLYAEEDIQIIIPRKRIQFLKMEDGVVLENQPVGAVHCRIGSGVLTAVPPCPPCAHCLRTSHLLSIALVECANLFPERILLILTRCVRLSSEKSACAKVRPVRPVRKCEQKAEVRREARARAKVRPVRKCESAKVRRGG